MTDQEGAGDLAARAIALAEKVAGTHKAIVAQQGKSRRNIRLLIVSVILDVILSVTALFLYQHQSAISAQIHQSQLTACRIGNEFRIGQIRLWEHVIAVSVAPRGETAADRKARLAKVARFRAYIAAQFHPVDCTKLYRQS